jgi:hypothetical protein
MQHSEHKPLGLLAAYYDNMWHFLGQCDCGKVTGLYQVRQEVYPDMLLQWRPVGEWRNLTRGEQETFKPVTFE